MTRSKEEKNGKSCCSKWQKQDDLVRPKGNKAGKEQGETGHDRENEAAEQSGMAPTGEQEP